MDSALEETLVPHVGWLRHEAGDDVGRYLREGWFEHLEQALCWLYLRDGDTVIDCGAHVGLFTLLAMRATGASGRVLAIEPNPHTASLLRRNIDALGDGLARVEIVQAAAASQPGSITLHAGVGRTAAYSSAVAPVDQAEDVRVAAVTIDDLLRERGVARAALLKIDVEGAELDVWKGCAQSVRNNRLELVMVEFTEANQRAAGATTADLVQAWRADGWEFHRFDPSSLQLAPAKIDGPIEYENLFAARDVEPINHRLHDATDDRIRIVRETLNRGGAAMNLLTRATQTEHYRNVASTLEADIRSHENMIAHLRAAADRDGQRLASEIERGNLAEQRAAMLQQRVSDCGATLDQVMNSRIMRLAYRLRLADRPSWPRHAPDDLQPKP
jgi:FkbM family methyltransferase